MSWPQLDDFRWAIQDPATCFADPDLQAGEVVCDMFGMPKVASGNFACAYEIHNGERRWAVRTFNHEVTDQQIRYHMVSDHLGSIGIPYMVRFQFQPEGIMVGGLWYPIVKMSWVEGMTLTRWVKEHRDEPDMIRDFAKDWRGMVGALYGLQMAHADLQQGNVLVTPGDQLKLIDYDGMFVPKMQGNSAPELGHPNWNHPARSNNTFGPYLDQFPGLVGYVSLLAVAERPTLLDEYCNDENLILSEADLAAPRNSAIVQELQNIEGDGISDLTEALIKWCDESVDYETLENIATGGSSPPQKEITKAPAESVAEDKRNTPDVSAPAKSSSSMPYLIVAAVVIIAIVAWGFLSMFSSDTKPEITDSAAPPAKQTVQIPEAPETKIPKATVGASNTTAPPESNIRETPPPAATTPPPKAPTRTVRNQPPTQKPKTTVARNSRSTTPPPSTRTSARVAPTPDKRPDLGSADKFYARGLERVRQMDWIGAEADFSKAIDLRKDDPEYYRERGNVRLRRGDLVGARLDYDKSIELNPRYSAAYNSRGVLRRRQRDLAGARADYDRAIALNPIESTYFRNRGNLRRQMSDLQGALEDYDQTIALNTDDSIAYNSRGVVREQLRDFRGAKADYDEAIKMSPAEPTFFQNRSRLRRQMGDLVGAQSDLDRAMKLRSQE